MRLLSEEQDQLLRGERRALNELQLTLVTFQGSEDDLETLKKSLEQLDDLFLLVVVGEFNAGKSAFINALLGQPLLKEGVTPTTTHINLLRYGQEENRSLAGASYQIHTLPIDWLAEISIVDTPGTNAIVRAHEAITSQFVPRSDLVLFITSADRPFTESERQFLEKIRNWGKKVVLVINKIDILQNEADLEQIQAFVAENARTLLGITPEIFPVSARKALLAKRGQPALWKESRFEPLEDFIHRTLDEKGRLKLKLLSPLGVGRHLAGRYLDIVASRLDLLKTDLDTLADVDAQLAEYEEDLRREFTFRMSDLENILYEMEQRGDDYFEETFRLAKVFDLINKERTRQEFERIVVGDTPQRIERKVGELIDWLVDNDLRQWQAVRDHLAERRRAHQDRILGDTAISSFDYDRERLIDAVGREAMRVVETYDKSGEAALIAEGAQTAVAASAAVEVGAVGLGALVAALATTAAADITGIVMASLVAALGLFIIPARRRSAKQELRTKISALREQLTASLKAQFEKEIERSLERIHTAIAPYTRFVRAERSKLDTTRDRLEELALELEGLALKVEELG